MWSMNMDWITKLLICADRMRLKLMYRESVTEAKDRLVHHVDVQVENDEDLKATAHDSRKRVAMQRAAKALYAALQDRIVQQTAAKVTKSKPSREQIGDNAPQGSSPFHEHTALDNTRKQTDPEASDCRKSPPGPNERTEIPERSENHIGQLQEICQHNNWPLPKYTFGVTEGLGRYAWQCELTIPLHIGADDADFAVDTETDQARTRVHGTANSKGAAKQASAERTLLWLYRHKLIKQSSCIDHVE